MLNVIENIKQKLAVLIIVIILIAMTGALLHFLVEERLIEPKQLSSAEETYLKIPRTPSTTPPKIIYNLVGVVKKVEKDGITFEASIPQLNEMGKLDPKIEMRKAMITPATKYCRLIFVTEEGRVMPQEVEVSFKDIKIGYRIEVLSRKDISEEKEFEVVRIKIL